MDASKLILIILIIISLIFLFLAIHYFRVMQKCYSRCEAVVDSIAITGNGESAPVFRYQTDKEEITKKHMISSKPMTKFKTGDVVELFYNPQKPTQYILDNGSPYKFLVIIFLVAAITFLILAIVVYIILSR